MRLLRNITLCLLAIQMVGSTWMVPLIHLDFELRRDYIAKVLCINNDKPITVCGGKCFLNKQLDKAAQAQPLEAQTGSQEVQLNFYNQALETVELVDSFDDVKTTYALFNSANLSSSFIGDFFKPPRIC